MNNGQKAKGALAKFIKARNKKNGLQMTGTTTAKKNNQTLKVSKGMRKPKYITIKK